MSFGKLKKVMDAVEDFVLDCIEDYPGNEPISLPSPHEIYHPTGMQEWMAYKQRDVVKQTKAHGSKIEIYRDKVTKEWRWKLRSAKLHVCIAQSGEGYHSKEDLEKALQEVRDVIDVSETKDLCS